MGKVALLYLGGVFDRLEVGLRDFITVYIYFKFFLSVHFTFAARLSVCFR